MLMFLFNTKLLLKLVLSRIGRVTTPVYTARRKLTCGLSVNGGAKKENAFGIIYRRASGLFKFNLCIDFSCVAA